MIKFARHSLIALLLLGGTLLGSCTGSGKETSAMTEAGQEASQPSRPSVQPLRKDTEVKFLGKDSRQVLATVAVQIADDEEERGTGLMYRPSMPDSAGMLFIFERAEPQSFWMKNTAIPLDIIFANENREIVKIHSFAAPYAIDSFRSEQNAQYVVEVNGGFCEKHNIREGDLLEFSTPQ